MLQQMFEVTATRFHSATKMFASLINSVIDDTVLQTAVTEHRTTRESVIC